MKILGTVVLALVIALSGCEDPPPAPLPPPPAAKPDTGPAVDPNPPPTEESLFNKPFLYRVTRKANHRTSWLFGTVNAKYPVDFAGSPESVRNALMKSTHTMFEVPTGSAAHRDRTNLMAMAKGSLRREVGAAKFKKLLAITGHESRVLDVMKPWVVYLALEEKLAGDPPMDEAFESFAASYRKRMVHLETVREQVTQLDAILTFDSLGSLIDKHDDHVTSAEAAANAYRIGDEAALKAAIFPPDDERAKIQQQLMDVRSPIWAAKIASQFDDDATFVVVNVRYLIGPNNLPAALTALGWTVERVPH